MWSRSHDQTSRVISPTAANLSVATHPSGSRRNRDNRVPSLCGLVVKHWLRLQGSLVSGPLSNPHSGETSLSHPRTLRFVIEISQPRNGAERREGVGGPCDARMLWE